ncbi:MAG TPA: hypothetical protein VJZ00_14535 [Thermoanaerobaculia bacterium]|nr:hypothetical protein [Thermoanaerobaculia bacterium]
MYSDPTGERRDPLQELEERITRFRAKHIKPAYRKKGWSDAKIERAIQQMRADNRPLPKFSGVRKDLRCALAELATDCGSIHVLAHEFRGAIDDEAIAAKRDAINTTLLVEDDAAILPDVLYEIRGER